MKSKLFIGISALLLAAAGLWGCNTDENPITPQKMVEIRKKEQRDRQNFNPNMTPPPANGAPTSGR